MTPAAAEVLEAGARVRRFEWAHVLYGAVRSRRGMVGLAICVPVLLIACIGPAFAPHDANAFVVKPFAAPSAAAPLGGDQLGRDVLSRVLDGGWQLVILAAAATAIGVGLGAAAGIAAAYLKGWRDEAIMRVVDVLLAFPQLVFALLLVSVLGSSRWLLVVAVGISNAPGTARILRSTAMDVSERDFVKAVEMTGVPRWRVMAGEILPNSLTPLMVDAGLKMTYSIVIMAGLSFIGFGLPPGSPNWGTMINENRIGLTQNALGVVVPGLLLALLAVGLNMFTDAVARVSLGAERRATTVLVEERLGEEP